MRGRKPTPTVLHKLKGSFHPTRHGRDRKAEPVADGNLGADAPDWMSDEQRTGWRYVMERAPEGLLKRIDAGVLSVWVVAEDQHRTAARMQTQIDSDLKLPLLTKDKNGQPVGSPYLGIMNRAGARMLKAASDLGFSPASRPRIGVVGKAPQQDDSPWGQFTVIDGGKAQVG